MPVDLAHVLMEQAMKFGRTATIKCANAIAHSPSGAAAQYVHLELRPTEGGAGRTTMVPTHATDGRQLGDSDWMGIFKRMAADMDEKEKR